MNESRGVDAELAKLTVEVLDKLHVGEHVGLPTRGMASRANADQIKEAIRTYGEAYEQLYKRLSRERDVVGDE